MRSAVLSLYALLAIAATLASPARGEDTLTQRGPAPLREPGRVDVGGASILRPVTSFIRLPGGEHVQVAAKQPDLATGQSDFSLQPIVIDLLVAYTARAASHYSDIVSAVVDRAIQASNESFRLSHIRHIRLRLVHAYRTDYVEEGGHFEHVWRFADRGDGYMDEVHALRDVYRADIAVLVVDDPKGCGLATRVHADADEAFAVVHHACAAANYTLAHEIGHLIGASHDLSYTSGNKWRDIMSQKESCDGCPRLPIWSNPDVLVGGEPAGTPHRNARLITQQAARVAGFR